MLITSMITLFFANAVTIHCMSDYDLHGASILPRCSRSPRVTFTDFHQTKGRNKYETPTRLSVFMRLILGLCELGSGCQRDCSH